MKRIALIAVTFGALASALSVGPANAITVTAANALSSGVASTVEFVRYGDGYSDYNRGFNRRHGRGVKLFFGGRRHGGGYYGGNHRRNYGWGYGRGRHRGGDGYGYGSDYSGRH